MYFNQMSRKFMAITKPVSECVRFTPPMLLILSLFENEKFIELMQDWVCFNAVHKVRISNKRTL